MFLFIHLEGELSAEFRIEKERERDKAKKGTAAENVVDDDNDARNLAIFLYFFLFIFLLSSLARAFCALADSKRRSLFSSDLKPEEN